jgi:hypothetical protein
LDARAFVRNSLRVPRPKQIGPAWDRHTFVEQEGRMRPAEVAELEVDEAERIGALAPVSRSHPGARGAGISKPHCVTGKASPPPNFEGSS